MRKISGSEQNKKFKISRILSIVSTILCLVGGILFISSSGELLTCTLWWGFSMFYAIGYGIFILIGVLIGLKYQAGRSLLCLIIGIITLTTGLIYYSIIFTFGIIFTIIGSIVGLLGVLIKKTR